MTVYYVRVYIGSVVAFAIDVIGKCKNGVKCTHGRKLVINVGAQKSGFTIEGPKVLNEERGLERRGAPRNKTVI